jgi:hypothetical protein
MKQPVLVHLAQWFAGMCSEGKSVIIERPKLACVKMKISDNCTFCDGWL